MNRRFQLYVEGKDDLAVSCQLALLHKTKLCEPNDKNELAPKFWVKFNKDDGETAQGIDGLVRELKTLILAPSVERLGFIVDADDNPAGRWQSIRDRLRSEGYNAPDAADPNGTILEKEQRPRVGVWIWPDNQNTGMLEHFIESMIPRNDSLLPQARECVKKAISIEQRFPDAHTQKAIIHTWLAWQKKVGKPHGVAIQEQFLMTSGELVQRFTSWLIKLYG